MSRSSTLAIAIAALCVLATPLTAVAAPYIPKSRQCYGDCPGKCGRSIFLRATQCDPRLLYTLQSVQGCLPDQLFSLVNPRPARRGGTLR